MKIYLLGDKGGRHQFKVTTAQAYSSIEKVIEALRTQKGFKRINCIEWFYMCYELDIDTGKAPKKVKTKELEEVYNKMIKEGKLV